MICKDEWRFWTSDQAEKRLDEHSRAMLIGIARATLLPLESKIDLVDSEGEIVPGISSIFVPGHTPGMMAISLVMDFHFPFPGLGYILPGDRGWQWQGVTQIDNI